MADLPFFGNSLFGGSGGSGGISGVESFSIDDNGCLNVVYVDGRTENLGRVVGEDGSVYVPHISEQKVLSFTIEDSPGMYRSMSLDTDMQTGNHISQCKKKQWAGCQSPPSLILR